MPELASVSGLIGGLEGISEGIEGLALASGLIGAVGLASRGDLWESRAWARLSMLILHQNRIKRKSGQARLPEPGRQTNFVQLGQKYKKVVFCFCAEMRNHIRASLTNKANLRSLFSGESPKSHRPH